MKKNVLAHRKGCTLLACGALIFFGCFTFPIFNLSYEEHRYFTWLSLLTPCMAYAETGLLLGILYERKARNVTGITLILTILGLLCRYLLEFGEVSNTYNFTLANVALHLFAAVCINLFAACFSPAHD